MGKRQRRIRARSAPGRVAGAAKEKARARSPSSKTACPATFSQRKPLCPGSPLKYATQTGLPLKRFLCPENQNRSARIVQVVSLRLLLVLSDPVVRHGRLDGEPKVSRSARQISVDCRMAWQSGCLDIAYPAAAADRPFRHSRPPGRPFRDGNARSSVVRVWRANDDRSGEQRVLLDPGYERSRRVMVAHPGHEPAVAPTWSADRCGGTYSTSSIVLTIGSANQAVACVIEEALAHRSASRGDTGPVLLRSDLAASSAPPLQPAARRCTPG